MLMELLDLRMDIKEYSVEEMIPVDPIGVAESFSDPVQIATLTTSAILRTLDLKADVGQLHKELSTRLNEALTGDSSNQDTILYIQAQTLDLLFNNLLTRAVASKGVEQFRMFMDLALKSQAHSCKTLLALQALKHPHTQTVIKNQALFQQVNHAVESTQNKFVNELDVEKIHGNTTLGYHSTINTIPTNTPTASVGALNRPKNATG